MRCSDRCATSVTRCCSDLVTDDGVYVWHIAPGSITVRNVFLPRHILIDKVASLQKSLADRNAPFDETTAQELFLYLIAPLLPMVKSDRLVIVPHDDLHYVPFQVFKNPEDGRYLGERFQITYAPSATVLLGLTRSAGLSGGRLLAIADPSITAAGRKSRRSPGCFPDAPPSWRTNLRGKPTSRHWSATSTWCTFLCTESSMPPSRCCPISNSRAAPPTTAG